MDVTLPDGTVIKGVPDGTTKEQLRAKLGDKAPKDDEWAGLSPGKSLANFGKGVVRGVAEAPMFVNDMARGVETGITRLGGAAYTAAGGELTPEQAEKLTNPTSPVMTSDEIYGKAGIKLPEAKGGAGIVGEMLGGGADVAGAKGAVTAAKDLGKATVTAVRHPIDTVSRMAKPVVEKTVGSAIDSDLPIVGGGVKKALQSPTAKEGERLGKKMGVNFSTGELTGSSAARTVEDALANSARWSSKFTEANEKKTDAIVKKFKEQLDTITPETATREGMGEKMSSAYNQTMKDLQNARSAQAAADAEKAGLATGGAAIIEPTNFVKVLESFAKEGKSPTATKQQQAAAAQAESILASLKEKSPVVKQLAATSPRDRYSGDVLREELPSGAQPAKYKKITIKDLQNGLAGHGENAKSTGGMINAMLTASDRRFSKAAKEALEDDLDAAAQVGKGEGAEALKTFRDNYRSFSAKIGDIQQTAIGKIVGKAERDSQGNLVLNHEAVADRFLGMDPSQLKNALAFLDKNHPDVANLARRYTLEEAYNKASMGKGQSGAGMTRPFGKAEFLKALPDDAHLEALLGDKKAVSEVKDIAAALNRVQQWGATRKGSDTAIRSSFERLTQWGGHTIVKALIGDNLAEQMLNPQLRKQMAAEAHKVNNAANANTALGASTNPLNPPAAVP